VDQEQQLKNLETQAKMLTNEKVRKTEQLRLLRKQRDELLTKLSEEGLTPETLKQSIVQLQQEIDQDIINLKAQLPDTTTS